MTYSELLSYQDINTDIRSTRFTVLPHPFFFNQITGITESDSGRYVCTASDGVQVINQYVDLEVQGI